MELNTFFLLVLSILLYSLCYYVSRFINAKSQLFSRVPMNFSVLSLN